MQWLFEFIENSKFYIYLYVCIMFFLYNKIVSREKKIFLNISF
jgi:hypothetical protein